MVHYQTQNISVKLYHSSWLWIWIWSTHTFRIFSSFPLLSSTEHLIVNRTNCAKGFWGDSNRNRQCNIKSAFLFPKFVLFCLVAGSELSLAQLFNYIMPTLAHCETTGTEHSMLGKPSQERGLSQRGRVGTRILCYSSLVLFLLCPPPAPPLPFH